MTPSIRPLTQEQRQAAQNAAHDAVIRAIGTKPTREQFTYTTISKYPPTITRLISGLCMVLLLAVFTPSAIRLYVIGSQTFGQAVDDPAAMTAIGLATVLSADECLHPLLCFPRIFPRIRGRYLLLSLAQPGSWQLLAHTKVLLQPLRDASQPV